MPGNAWNDSYYRVHAQAQGRWKDWKRETTTALSIRWWVSLLLLLLVLPLPLLLPLPLPLLLMLLRSGESSSLMEWREESRAGAFLEGI